MDVRDRERYLVKCGDFYQQSYPESRTILDGINILARRNNILREKQIKTIKFKQ